MSFTHHKYYCAQYEHPLYNVRGANVANHKTDFKYSWPWNLTPMLFWQHQNFMSFTHHRQSLCQICTHFIQKCKRIWNYHTWALKLYVLLDCIDSWSLPPYLLLPVIYTAEVLIVQNLNTLHQKNVKWVLYWAQKNMFKCKWFQQQKPIFTAKLLKQGYQNHKLHKAFPNVYQRHSELIVKYKVGLKTLLQQGISGPVFYGDLVCNSIESLESFLFMVSIRRSSSIIKE